MSEILSGLLDSELWLIVCNPDGSELQVEFVINLSWNLLVLSHVFISGLEETRKHALIKFSNDIKLIDRL